MLFIDDNPAQLKLFELACLDLGLPYVVFDNVPEATDYIHFQKINFAVIDLMIDPDLGADFARVLANRQPEAIRIAYTALDYKFSSDPGFLKLFNGGILPKHSSFDQLKNFLEKFVVQK